MTGMRWTRRREWLLIGAAIAWCLWLAVGIVSVILVSFLGDAWCEQGVDSNYGEFSWQPVPPGARCEWTEDVYGFD
jgi:hypothetical protein